MNLSKKDRRLIYVIKTVLDDIPQRHETSFCEERIIKLIQERLIEVRITEKGLRALSKVSQESHEQVIEE